MLRAVGVPAKFVSGVAYTDSPLFTERWGGHGWAEVYFPEIGWVAFDPTFGEFGWIDVGHIKNEELHPEILVFFVYESHSEEFDEAGLDIKRGFAVDFFVEIISSIYFLRQRFETDRAHRAW